ncbi:hypothetical protein Y032_0004g1817 [Ancylostoma ceylanicum]|uniref:Uncharacterized protein n=1 Tax=Ancylostoma ceylanicum TaxID=53326 RepID=A0A016VVS2_9BILA|nr:hypothetical protein Y032_0004g1817 [Ancylostoma ceylanicum]
MLNRPVCRARNEMCGNKSKEIGHGFKLVYNGSPETRNGVGIVSQRFRDSIADVQRFDDRLMKVIVTTAEQHLYFFSAYAPQTGYCVHILTRKDVDVERFDSS